jgi:hypothetical protein
MLSRIKSIFVKERGLPQARLEELGRLPPDERLAALAAALHDLCVKTAARFVEEEHRRPESPFRGLAKADLFHELLVMNFWILEWLFKGRRRELMEGVFRQYGTSFVWGLESGQKELLDSMRGKFSTYDKAWDEYSGHQDVFARQAIGIIFGDQNVAGAPQAAFWLITYADQTMKDFTPLRKAVDALLGEKDSRQQILEPRR